jgi:hypothetical protein
MAIEKINAIDLGKKIRGLYEVTTSLVRTPVNGSPFIIKETEIMDHFFSLVRHGKNSKIKPTKAEQRDFH